MSGKTYLTNVDLNERSITLTPATRRMSLVTKTEIPMNETIKVALVNAALSEAGVAAVNEAVASLDKAKGELGPAYDKIMAAMASAMNGEAEQMVADKKAAEDAAKAATAKGAALAASIETALKSLDVEKPAVGAAAEELAKSIGKTRAIKHEDELPAHLKAIVEKASNEAAETRKALEVMKAEQDLLKATTTCKETYKSLPMAPGDLAKALLSMPAETRKAVEELLGKVDAILVKSAAFGEIGHSGNGNESDALGKLKNVAKSMRAADPSLTEAAAMVKAMHSNPDLRKAYETERRAGN